MIVVVESFQKLSVAEKYVGITESLINSEHVVSHQIESKYGLFSKAI